MAEELEAASDNQADGSGITAERSQERVDRLRDMVREQTARPEPEPEISEAASDIPAKPKRGRPSLWPDKSKPYLKELALPGQTDRSATNYLHAIQAMYVLLPETTGDLSNEWHAAHDRYRWLLGDCPSRYLSTDVAYCCQMVPEVAEGAKPKLSILAELGKIHAASGEKTMRSCADQITDVKPRPSVKEAVSMLRSWRLDGFDKRLKPANVYQLADRIEAVINAYDASHSGLTREMIYEALEAILWFCEPDEDEPGEG
jgi:hypothetical protein